MRKAILFLSLLFLVAASLPHKIFAGYEDSCRGVISGTNVSLPFWREDPPNNYSHTIVVDMSSYDKTKEYELNASFFSRTGLFKINQNTSFTDPDGGTVTVQGSKVTWVIRKPDVFKVNNYFGSGTEKRNVYIFQDSDPFCTMGGFTVTKIDIGPGCKMYVWQEDRGGHDACYSTGCMQRGEATFVLIEGLKYNDASKSPYDGDVRVQYSGGEIIKKQISNGSVEVSFNPSNSGTQNIAVFGDHFLGDWEVEGCYTSFSVTNDCGDLCEETKTDVAGTGVGITGNFRLCEQTGNNVDRQKCLDCVGGTTLGGQKTGMWTAIGCIPTNAQGIITTIIQLGLGIGGGVTLLLILAGAFRLSVAQGDPKQAEEAKEQITSAVIGLLFIIFSITMLRFIGVQVLNIPGFGVN